MLVDFFHAFFEANDDVDSAPPALDVPRLVGPSEISQTTPMTNPIPFDYHLNLGGDHSLFLARVIYNDKVHLFITLPEGLELRVIPTAFNSLLLTTEEVCHPDGKDRPFRPAPASVRSLDTILKGSTDE